MRWRIFISLLALATVIASCSKNENKTYQFEILSDDQTNLDFENRLVQTKDMNIMHYLYFFNGGGVAAGDFNNDGKVDLFFTSNVESSRMYLNRGNFQFDEIIDRVNITLPKCWTTGVSVVDINNDGMLDLYICQVGGFLDFSGRNRLFVCKKIEKGIPLYEEEAESYGLAFSGFSTQAMFFDYDLDGDLDMYLLNHSVHENGTFGERVNFLGKAHKASGDRLFRNDDGFYADVTAGSGIHSMVIGYGLGIVAGDLNNDGWPDIYVGNDFHENDYLYINQRDGTFKEELQSQMTHTSRFSMGVDIGDVNNDAYGDVISLDMLPYDPIVLKSSLGENEIAAFNFKLTYGYSIQFARNNLQLNNGDGTFSEIGRLATVHNTDWSWASLFLDYDNDGYKDLFVTNGIPARMNDIDYVNFRSGDVDHQWKTQAHRMEMEDLEIIKKIPEIKFPNKIFSNSGALVFKDIKDEIKNDRHGFSNGAAYADLDNDGDLDVVTNNINDKAFIYRNLTNENAAPGKDYIKLRFHGIDKNVDAIGARVIVFKGKEKISAENFTVRGFQSSMAEDLIVGVGDSTKVDSVVVIWPDRRATKIKSVRFNALNVVEWSTNDPVYNFALIKKTVKSPFNDVTAQTGLEFRHKENPFIEFDRERLIPFMVSSEGPGVAVGDINNDGREDIFITGAKMSRGRLYSQTSSGTFQELAFPAMKEDTLFEDVDALFLDIDNDNDLDLVLAAGGNEFWGESEFLKQRYYLNDGKGNFSQKKFLPTPFMTASCVIENDFNGDGLVDLFFGGRAVPNAYGKIPESCLLQNLGGGSFADVTDVVAPGLRTVGMVTDGKWIDINQDGKLDLLVALEWDAIKAFVFDGNSFSVQMIGKEKGWWHFLFPVDADSDGDIDLIAGNAGTNTRFQPTSEEPLRLYVNDFDDNDQVEQVLTYYVDHREIPFATHAELTKQLPALKKKFLYAKDFANASLEEMFGAGKLKGSVYHEVDYLKNAYYENLGRGNGFKRHDLPVRLQFSTIRAGALLESAPAEKRIFLGGNFNDYNIEMGYSNADFGNVLRVKDKALTVSENESVGIKGQIRNVVPVIIGKRVCLLVVRNNDSAIVLEVNR